MARDWSKPSPSILLFPAAASIATLEPKGLREFFANRGQPAGELGLDKCSGWITFGRFLEAS